jgi:hypothetical protein
MPSAAASTVSRTSGEAITRLGSESRRIRRSSSTLARKITGVTAAPARATAW